MKTALRLGIAALGLATFNLSAATLYVSLKSANPVPPFATWATAARVIQDAVDAAAPGDTVLVTNGVYVTGGRPGGTNLLSNRVAIEKPIRLESVNGPAVTIIEGARASAGDERGNGDGAIRCVYLRSTNAVISGFTLTNGYTRTAGAWPDQCGGGVWSGSLSSSVGYDYREGCATVTNCVFIGNSAEDGGGAAWGGILYSCTLEQGSSRHGGGASYTILYNCEVTGNSAGFGGGVYCSTLHNCSVTANSTYWSGGGAFSSTLYNCSVIRNLAKRGGSGVCSSEVYNSIVYFNSGGNHSGSWFAHSCTTPLQAGPGNIDDDPQLASDTHLSSSSPCRAAGSAQYASGFDGDGEPWANPPSMGADELVPGHATGPLEVAITAAHTNLVAGFAVRFEARIVGRLTQSSWDFGDGAASTNQPLVGHAWNKPGIYMLKLTGYNDTYPGGVHTSLLVEVVDSAVHFVSHTNPTPVSPYTSWETAANNIQDAIDAGTVAGRLVMVTNGLYRTGATIANGTNRILLTGPMEVRSVNGPAVTVIEGDTNGVRCASLADGAVLSGFTLTNGMADAGGGVFSDDNGAVTNCVITGNRAQWGGGAEGGVLYSCTLTSNSALYDGGGADRGVLHNCTVTGNSADYNRGGANDTALNNCTVSNNSALYGGGGVRNGTLYNCTLTANSSEAGGGAYSATLNNCVITNNSAVEGGGAYEGTLKNCLVSGNSAARGGGVYGGTLSHCTMTGNSATLSGGGVHFGTLNNCVVYFNTAANGANYAIEDWGGNTSLFDHCCTAPLPVDGTGNISLDPQLVNASHLSASSPCRRAGSAAYATGTDIDGEPWVTPPSIGCDEYHDGAATGPLSASIRAAYTNVAPGFTAAFTAFIEGRTTASVWDFGGGVTLANRPYATHAWQSPGDYEVVLIAYNESNPEGVKASVRVHVMEAVHYVSLSSTNPVSPYSSWATAATNIQDAVDAVAVPGAAVLVTNGVYATGAHMTTNEWGGVAGSRVHITNSIRLESVNGPELTIIQGERIVRDTGEAQNIQCVFLGPDSVLSGFTLTNGYAEQGGGVLSEDSGSVSNCVILGNSATYGGGACGGVLYNCLVKHNRANERGGKGGGTSGGKGGGAYRSILHNCKLIHNSAWGRVGYNGVSGLGGGIANGTLVNCVVSNNQASVSGGGAYASVLNNCAVMGNEAEHGGGTGNSVVNNSTLTSNYAKSGGGAHGGTLNNCIVYFNSATNGANYSETILSYCCTTPMPTNSVGNITLDPQLASASHLSVISPCRGAGSLAYARGTDIDGEAWADPPSMGCDEYHPGAAIGPLSVAIEVTLTNAAVGYPVNLMGLIEGRATLSIWNFGDGVLALNQPYMTRAWTTAGEYLVTLWAYNDNRPEGVSATVRVHVGQGLHYVAAGNANPVPPYSSWATAATNIQDAVDAAVVGGTVMVSNGVYSTGGRATGGNVLVSRVVVDKILTLQGVNGPEVTIISGHQVPGDMTGESAIRCVSLANGAVLSGFTLTNGMAEAGGGVMCESSASVVSNCVIVGNSAHYGGGARDGTLYNCTLIGNSTTDWGDGGGTLGSVLHNCTLRDNVSTWNGGGAAGGALYNCTLTGNSAGNVGGGACYVLAYGCLFRGNSARTGGGASGTLNNCIVAGNSAQHEGGGTFGSDLYNCTVTGNSASGKGGGIFSGTARNSIIRENVPSNWSNWPGEEYAWMQFCCTTPMPTIGVGNISNAPLFVNQAAGDLRLQSSSPCINAGNTSYAPVPTDLDGLPRVVSGTVDIGAYEFQGPGSLISYAWLRQFGLPTDGSADATDLDADGHNTWEEWRCQTNPTNALSTLYLLAPLQAGINVTVSWESVVGVNYFLERSTDLSATPPFTLLVPNIPGQPGTTTYTDSNAVGVGPFFYRVGVSH